MTGRGDAMYMREACGIITQSDTTCFNAAYLARFGARDNWVRSSNLGMPKYCFVAIDPAGGGTSALAIASGVCTQEGAIVIVGADARPVASDEDMEAVLRAHMSGLRDVPALTNSQIILVIE